MRHKPAIAPARAAASAGQVRLELCRLQGRRLALAELVEREPLDLGLEQAVEVELGLEVQEDPAEPDRRPIHEDELARHRHRALLPQRHVDLVGLPAAVFGRAHALGDAADPIGQERPVDEAGPDVEDVDQLGRELLEAPDLIGMDDPVAVVVQEPAVEVDDPADEFRREDADAAVVEEIDAARLPAVREHGVVAEMRVAMDDAVVAEGVPPSLEHRSLQASGDPSLAAARWTW